MLVVDIYPPDPNFFGRPYQTRGLRIPRITNPYPPAIEHSIQNLPSLPIQTADFP